MINKPKNTIFIKTLKDLQVKELTQEEKLEIDGGFFGPFRLGLILAYGQMWGITFPRPPEGGYYA